MAEFVVSICINSVAPATAGATGAIFTGFTARVAARPFKVNHRCFVGTSGASRAVVAGFAGFLTLLAFIPVLECAVLARDNRFDVQD